MYFSFIVMGLLILFITTTLFAFPSYFNDKTFTFATDDISSSSWSFKSSQSNNTGVSILSSSSPRLDANLTIHNTTGTVSLVGAVYTSGLTRPQFKPFVDMNSNESYLTRDYATYKAAKNQSALIRPSTRVFEVQIPYSINYSSTVTSGFGRQDNNKAVHSTTQEDFIIHGRRHAAAAAQINQSGSLIGFEGLTQNCCDPPDVQVAAGSNYVVEMVNLDGAIYTKNGTLIKEFGLDQFFNPSVNGFSKSGDSLSDPSLLFDSQSGRWYASISDTTTQSIRVAISKTDNPTGIWRVYDFPFKSQSNNCSDQPFIGVSNDKFVVAVNNWANNCDWYSDNRPPEFRGVQFTVADKADLLSGGGGDYDNRSSNIRSVQSDPNLSNFSLHPVVTLSPTSSLLIVSVGDLNYKKLQVFHIDGPISNLHIKVISDLIQTTHVPPDGIQPTTNLRRNGQCCNSTASEHMQEHLVSTGDSRVLSSVWYQGKLWLTFNDGCFANGDVKSRSCIRIIQLDTTTSRVIQDFDVAAVGSSLYYPSLSTDRAGNLGIIFGYSSRSVHPSLLVSMRLAKDIPNTIEQPLILQLGSDNALSNRYGDYFAAFSDPSSEHSTIWVAGQYHAMKTWSTYIGRLYIH